MHIVQLANFHGPRSGGLRTALDALATRYASAGHRCTLIVPAAEHHVSATAWGSVIGVAAPMIPGLGGYRVITDVKRVDWLLTRLAPDVVELSDKTTLARAAGRARRRGATVVLVSHERLDAVLGHVTRLGGLVGSPVRRFDRRLVADVDAIVCASRFAAAEFDGVPCRRIEHIPLGVDLARFTPRAAGRRPGPLRLVSVVRLSPEKSPHLLVETSRALAERGVEHEYLVLGDGPRRRRLVVAAHGLPIRFAGHCADRQAVAAAMSDADIGIAPGPNETFGLAALELLASGTPVVVADRGALPEVIGTGVGLTAPATGAGFAAAIAHLRATVMSPTAEGTIRAAARRHAEQFDWDMAAGSFLDLFAQLRSGPPDGAQREASAAGRSYL